jgi:tight adherence protein C
MFDTVQPVFWLAFTGLSFGFLGLMALLYAENQNSQHRARLRRANGTARHLDMTQGSSVAGLWARGGSNLRRIILGIGERLSIVLGSEACETAQELASAGYRGRDALLIFAFMKTVLPLATLVLGLGWLMLTRPLDLGLLIPVAVVIAAALGLSKGVDMFIDAQRKARLEKIRLAFPDMLELLVITAEAGLGPQPGLHRVAHELSATHPELGRDVLQLVSEMTMTNDRRNSYDSFNARIPLPEISVFTQTLDQSDRYGTPFSRAMRTLMDEQRSNRMTAIEEKAARLPVIMTIPLIFCIMPAVFVVLVGPAVLSVIDNILSGG